MIFVFGSNEAGIHGAGAARFARLNRGAMTGVGSGPQGESYAIPTKGMRAFNGRKFIGETLPLSRIKEYVDDFIAFAEAFPEKTFMVTQVGCGLAGLRPEDVAPLFGKAPKNCLFDEAWKQFLPDRQYWGTC
jgi:hypothetical protein